jgi:hypothetical protein
MSIHILDFLVFDGWIASLALWTQDVAFERRSFLQKNFSFFHLHWNWGASACANWALFLMPALDTFTPTGVMNWARVRALLGRT